MAVFNIGKENEFQDTVKSGNLVVVHFYAEWVEQCGVMNEVLEELAKQSELKNVKFAKCLAENVPELSMKYSISAVPTILLLRGGSLLDRVNGANAAELTKKINQQVSKSVPTPTQSSAEQLKDRMCELVKAAPVMLFMKGSAVEPKCGFSRTIIGILDSHNAQYKTYDILNDEEVRQGLKSFSNWPTYPQLYINGELIGGLDIVKELDESGELKNLLPKQQPLEERLKLLISKSDCMVFMKGDRDTPRCGFSRQLMAILKETGTVFETFDILKDEEVRQGLKTFSDWPTYPQVYIKGELIGGLDIINELKTSGKLLDTLKGEES